MKRFMILVFAIVLLLVGCSSHIKTELNGLQPLQQESRSTAARNPGIDLINETGATIADRFQTPKGYERVEAEKDSFGAYLRNFPLKLHGSPVKLYDGSVKAADVHAAVLDIDIGDKNLQQCADAVMRLRADYLYKQGQYDKIHFNFTNGFKVEYSKWRQGYRIAVDGNRTSWVKKTQAAGDYESFRKYMDIVFAYAGTASLEKEMNKINFEDMQIGDVFIKGGSPGHCVIIMDMAKNKETGEMLFLLAQSYMPAQDIHLLKNPQNDEGNPWYSINVGETLDTPEWDFSTDQLRRF